ncbi:Hemocytin [Mizuhopecten yessoensis]|uniref:Hemocytin n=1 Tax=Mizuhopecten yessoensis TaxID=6573 RepID=A0A210QFE1_MIZYE|nr:Hemocytin [Mizuhopecten yessoensis]
MLEPLLTELCNDDRRYSRHLSELTDEIKALTKRVQSLEDCAALLNITVCSDYLVSGLYGVKNSALYVSSSWLKEDRYYHGEANSRLYNERNDNKLKTGAWSSQYKDNKQFIQVKFPRETEVETILLRGRNEFFNQWVKTYHLLYSMDGTNWTTVMSDDNQPRVFTGNNDTTTIVKASVVPSITAVYLRINPRSWNNHVSLRFDVSGCYTVRETRKHIHKALGFQPVLNDDTLYKVNERDHNQLDAARLCTKQYSQLIKIDSLSLMASLQAVVEGNDILRNAHNQMYVSGKYVANTWLYSDVPEVIGSALWSPGNPDPTQGHCVMLTSAGLASVNCSQALFSVCGHI